LAQEANKMAIAFKSEPLPIPEETRAMCAQVEQKTVLILSLYLSLPPGCGKHLLTTVGTMCSEAVAGLIELVKFLELKESVTESDQEAMLLIVGSVWEKCDAIAKKLPSTNWECCSDMIHAQRALVGDATKELEEALKLAIDEEKIREETVADDDEDSFCPGETWSQTERLLVPRGAGLLKTAAAILKKAAEAVREPSHANRISRIEVNNEIDKLTELCLSISPIADDLSWSLYAPIDKESLMQNGHKLRIALQDILEFVKTHDSVGDGNDERWVKFLDEALEHNWSKLCEVECENEFSGLKIK